MPLAAVGLPPAGPPNALATLTVGSQELCGAGRVGEGPKVCSVTAVSCSLHAASGSAKIATIVTSGRFFASFILLRMLVPRLWRYNTESPQMFTVLAMNFV